MKIVASYTGAEGVDRVMDVLGVYVETKEKMNFTISIGMLILALDELKLQKGRPESETITGKIREKCGDFKN